ncbi:MAG: hypothetical protein K2F94_10175 [Muribaculaceae bacterium]|nr:hypothetical protein [Muribaculaceae bacterium]
MAISLASLTLPVDISAASGAITVPLTPPSGESDTDHDDQGKHRRRTPPRPVMLTVDFDTKSMTITGGIDTSEIVAYEIRDNSGQTLYVFYEETDFVATLSSLTQEEYQIILSFPSYYLSGYFIFP